MSTADEVALFVGDLELEVELRSLAKPLDHHERFGQPRLERLSRIDDAEFEAGLRSGRIGGRPFRRGLSVYLLFGYERLENLLDVALDPVLHTSRGRREHDSRAGRDRGERIRADHPRE